MKKGANVVFLPVGMGLGMALGAALGAATGDLALWLSLGVAIGSGLGVALMGLAGVAAQAKEKGKDGGDAVHVSDGGASSAGDTNCSADAGGCDGGGGGGD